MERHAPPGAQTGERKLANANRRSLSLPAHLCRGEPVPTSPQDATAHGNDKDERLPTIEAAEKTRRRPRSDHDSGRPEPIRTRISDDLVRYSPSVFSASTFLDLSVKKIRDQDANLSRNGDFAPAPRAVAIDCRAGIAGQLGSAKRKGSNRARQGSAGEPAAEEPARRAGQRRGHPPKKRGLAPSSCFGPLVRDTAERGC